MTHIQRQTWYTHRHNRVEGTVRVSEVSGGRVIFIDADGRRRLEATDAFRTLYRQATGAEIDAAVARW